MAQEDNILTARMAVTSTRDSSSLKALAVITAVFMPGDFMASIFGMSMWEAWYDQDAGHTTLLPPRFWLYFKITLPLTIVILVAWRAWWVSQDRFFRKHLSKELSEERYWTEDRRPRRLEHSYIYDFFMLSARKDEIRSDFSTPKDATATELPYSLPATGTVTPTGSRPGSFIEDRKSPSPLPRPPPRVNSGGTRQISFAGTNLGGGNKSRRSRFRG